MLVTPCCMYVVLGCIACAVVYDAAYADFIANLNELTSFHKSTSTFLSFISLVYFSVKYI